MKAEKKEACCSSLRIVSLIEVLVVNGILIALFLWITGDYAFRASYWASEGFTPTMVRYPLFFLTSAEKGSISIPGQLTVDWQQIVPLLLAVVDAIYLSSLFRSRRRETLTPA